jgi:hypothetical protein
MIANKIMDEDVLQYPFPHQIIDNFFTEDEYVRLIYALEKDATTPIHLPDEECYPDKQHIIDIEEITENFHFWDDLMEQFSHPDVLEALTSKWDLKYPVNSTVYNIHKDKKGFNRGPHNDVKSWNKEMTTIQVYCPSTTWLAHTGAWLHGKENKQITFLPNRAWIFKACEDSVHSVRETEDEEIRDSILVKYCATRRRNE